ncbi:LysM peptidoglycan-binding domain-containing protein [Moritella sp. 5]|uniref:PGRP and LysM peptidoglycan-binding domain-containing protein n=1 Tax=Moritella sp. 5 TaxID=2746231 RepID=UPI001BA810AF|nr:peptidoglycan-binding domain-containing protein [Moritella sp. 5]QUM80929.1 LysM peptidoglycan-binding domain-containing protein [Moritella sp. 5]
MAEQYTVVQGDTLPRIAKHHGFANYKAIYEHESNTDFRTKRDNPNIIYPGDVITIPDPEPVFMALASAKINVFKIKKHAEYFRADFKDSEGNSWAGKRVVLSLDGVETESLVNDDGTIEIELEENSAETGILSLYFDDGSQEPSEIFDVSLGHLDPVDTETGIQARCRLLGFDCGDIDGNIAEKSTAGIKGFQAEHGLAIDGNAAAITQAKLKEIYGC